MRTQVGRERDTNSRVPAARTPAHPRTGQLTSYKNQTHELTTPSSLVQLRITVWTGYARDIRPRGYKTPGIRLTNAILRAEILETLFVYVPVVRMSEGRMQVWTEVGLRIAGAVIAGGIIGLNRDLLGKPSGVRVHALVALGAALLTLSSTSFGLAGSDANAVSRVMQGIVGGIGFLGAGVILRGGDGGRIFHVATAASIWVTAAVGIACGLGAWPIASIGAVSTVLILEIGGRIDRALRGKLGDETKNEQ